ncbi:hypothetical protein DL98DRAFT_517993 [Cadophora sp. DSE1049]|nr:hypothetical protein DL98DRAFT_517993 [Cadophora sp. DSE1049]
MTESLELDPENRELLTTRSVPGLTDYTTGLLDQPIGLDTSILLRTAPNCCKK